MKKARNIKELSPSGKLTLIAIEVIILIPICYIIHFAKLNEFGKMIPFFGLLSLELISICIFILYKQQKENSSRY